MRGLFQKQEDVLFPYDADAVKWLGKKKDNAILTVNVKEERSPQYHRRQFKMFTIMHDMLDGDMEFEEFRRLLTVKAGYYKAVGNVDGSVMVVPDSLAFTAMNQPDFQKCFEAMHRAFCTKFGEKLTMDQLNEWASM